MNKNQTIYQQLLLASTSISYSLSTDHVLEALTPMGYDTARLQAALNLYEAVETAAVQQKNAYGVQYQATADLNTARHEANTVYMTAVKIARLVFHNNVQARASLRLAGDRERRFAVWLEQVTVFYENLLASPTLLAAMAPYGYDTDRLTAELALVREVEAANQRQEVAKGEARAATQARNDKLQELQEWMSAFRVIASIALADNIQALETLKLQAVP